MELPKELLEEKRIDQLLEKGIIDEIFSLYRRVRYNSEILLVVSLFLPAVYYGLLKVILERTGLLEFSQTIFMVFSIAQSMVTIKLCLVYKEVLDCETQLDTLLPNNSQREKPKIKMLRIFDWVQIPFLNLSICLALVCLLVVFTKVVLLFVMWLGYQN
jgi:hypothetical protein